MNILAQAQCVLLDWGLTKQLSEQRRLAACHSAADALGLAEAEADSQNTEAS